MRNVSDYLGVLDLELSPNTLGGMLKRLGGFYEQIAAVYFSDSADAVAALSEQVRPLRRSLKFLNRSAVVAPIPVEIYWARESNLVLWPAPGSVWHDHAILFHAYSEFVRWTQWRLRACLRCTQEELVRIGLELGSLRR